MFVSTPLPANDRKLAVEKILLSLREHDEELLYSIDNGECDLRVRVRYYSKHGYIPYRTFPIEYIDLSNYVPPIQTRTVEDPPPEVEEVTSPIDETNPDNWQQLLKGKKRKERGSLVPIMIACRRSQL